MGDQRATPPAGALVAGIELGGTKTVVALGLGDGTVLAEERFPTLDPETTLAQAAATVREQAARIVAWYLAHGLRNVVYALAPERIVLGGRAGVIGALLLAYFSAYPSYPAAATSSHFSR